MPLIAIIAVVVICLAFAGLMEFRFWRSVGRLIRGCLFGPPPSVG